MNFEKSTDVGIMLTNVWNAIEKKADSANIRRQETYSGASGSNGEYAVNFATAFPAPPMVVPILPNQTDRHMNAIVKSVSANGFTISVYTRPVITTLPVLGTLAAALLGATTTSSPGVPIDVLVIAK